MHITILTLFPNMFKGPFSESIVRRAIDKAIVQVDVRDIRSYTRDKHHAVDDTPFGGGPGMVMKPEPIFEAANDAKRSVPEDSWVVLLTPQGRVFDQAVAGELATKGHLVLICGHYEGVDERISQHLADDEVSLGNFVLTGGEPAAIAIIDALVRLLPGSLGDPKSAQGDSFASGVLQHPQYTRPRVYQGWKVPEVLLSGDHQAIARWRRHQSVLRTINRRPDLLDDANLPPTKFTKVSGEEVSDKET